jgi:hypothetical protein
MANTSRINGFRPVKHLNGSPYNGQVNVYHIPASDGTAVYVGDVVKYAGSSTADGTKPTVALAAAGDAIVGVVVGFAVNRDNINIGGSYRAASTARDVLVCDSPDVVFEVETSNGTPAATDVGLNINHATGSPDTATARSGAYVDFGTEATTAALTFKILGFVPREDNEVGASAKLLVKINNHQHGSHTGTAGV